MSEKTIKIGLIGLGNMGRNHLRVLSMLKGVEVAFISDVNAEAAARAGKAYGIANVVDSASPFPNVDAVVICTPTVTHADYIRLAAAHVHNIFVEKPLAANYPESLEIYDFVKGNGINLQVGFIERFNPAVQAMKVVLDKSERIINIDFTRTNKVSSRITDVDVITDLMIHDIDLAIYINGPVCDVSAHGYSHGKMLDFTSALLKHENGRFSRIQASRVTDKKMRKIEGTCMDMFVDCDLLRKEIIINRHSEMKNGDLLPYTISAVQETVSVPPQEALLSELQAFVSACKSNDWSGVPGVDSGVEAMKICADIQQAV
jgi:predicted dehydrogenase